MKHANLLRLIALILLFATAVFLFGARFHQAEMAVESSGATGVSGEGAASAAPLDRVDLEAFVDDYFERNMAARHVAGVSIVFIRDGEVLLAKGYGYADLAQQRRVDPARTLFRWASVSKLFPIAGILQLAEQGHIDLDADVNRYLREWEVENAFAEPVRVRHLLTHTDGFGTRDLATFSLKVDTLRPLGKVLAGEIVAPVQPPGRFITYGGYGTALAGHLLEQRSGLPFATYARRSFFAPLAMAGSTFAQEVPPPLSAQVATVYDYEAETDSYAPAPFLYVNTPPTGGLSATPLDMARFVGMLLNEGAAPGQQLLAPDSVALMMERQFTPHPELPGVTYGFMEHFYNGQRGLLRDGSGVGIRSQVYLLPAHNLAYVYVQNSRGDALVEAFNEAFLDRYFPGPVAPATPLSEGNLAAYSGVYRPTQTNKHTLVKLESLLIGELAVTAHPDGTLTISPQGQGDVYGGFETAARYRQVGPHLFRRLDRERYVAFAVDEAGQATHLFSGSGYHGSYGRIGRYESASAQLLWLAACVLLFLSALLIWVPGLPARGPHAGRPFRGARWVAVAVSLLLLTGLAGVFYGLFLKRIAGFPAFAFGISSLTSIMLGVLLLAVILGATLFPLALLAWRRGAWTVWGRVHYTLLAAAVPAFAWWLHYWNLLGFRF